MPSPLYFATSNEGKLREVRQILGGHVQGKNLELEEIQSTEIEEILRYKLRQAYEQVQGPVMVEDTALYFLAWDQLPGVLIKYFLKNLGCEGMVKALHPFEDHRALAVCGIAYTNGEREEICLGRVPGTIVAPSGSSGFGWDRIFQPEGYTETYSQLGEEVKLKISHRRRAVDQLKQILHGS